MFLVNPHRQNNVVSKRHNSYTPGNIQRLTTKEIDEVIPTRLLLTLSVGIFTNAYSLCEFIHSIVIFFTLICAYLLISNRYL